MQQTIFVFICLTFHLAYCPQDSSVLLQMARFSSFFYGWMIFHCMYVPPFLYPFVQWWTISMVFLIVNNAAVNMRMHLFKIVTLFSSDIYGSGSAGSYGSFIFSIWGAFILFPVVAVPIYIPTSSAQGSLFCTFLQWLLLLFVVQSVNHVQLFVTTCQ